MYELSDDYEVLYKLLLAGYEVVCYFNKSKDFDFGPHRWVIFCRREEDGVMSFHQRSQNYGKVVSANPIPSWEEEKDRFLEACEDMEVEWIKPNKLVLIDVGALPLGAEVEGKSDS